MKTARIRLTDRRGVRLWRGSLLTFAKDNAFDRESVREVVRQLRELGCALIGGGASPPFLVELVS